MPFERLRTLCSWPPQVARVVAECKALRARGQGIAVIPAADFAAITSSALAAIASADVCAFYCNAIVVACHSKKENCVACGAGVITAVLAMMQGHLASKTVQTMACCALSLLVQGGSDIIVRVMASGGLEGVYAAMAAYPMAEVLQKYACCALCVLAESAEGVGRIASDGRALGLLRQAMAAHPDDSAIQLNAAKALASLRQPEVSLA